MGAFLVPTSGGDAIRLKRSRIYLGRASDADRTAPPNRDTALCLLELVDGWWHIEDIRSPNAVRINGVACKRQKLASNDEFEIGKHTYRICYETPRYRFGRDAGGGFQRSVKSPSSHALPTVGPAKPHGRLVPLGGGQDHALKQQQITVGRRAPCQLVIKQATVSGKHCELEFIDGFWFVRDLDSRNGIRIDGKKCEEGWVLPGNRLTIGDQHYQLDYTADGPPPIGAVAVKTDKSLMDQLGISEGDLNRSLARQDEQADEDGRRKKWDLMQDFD